MQLEHLREVPGLRVSYDHANQWVYADWYGQHTQATSEVACEALLAVLRERPCAKVLNDNSNIEHSTSQITDAGRQWMRNMHEAGLHYFVWVNPTATMDRQMTENALHSPGRPIVVTFADVASACSWLQRQAEPC